MQLTTGNLRPSGVSLHVTHHVIKVLVRLDRKRLVTAMVQVRVRLA